MWLIEDLRGKECYLDSNIIIYAFEGVLDLGLGHSLSTLFADIETGVIRASVITRSEVLVYPLRHGNTELADFYRRALSGRSGIAVRMFDLAVADLAAELRGKYAGPRLADAIHLATALYAGCQLFITADKRLLATSEGIEMFSLEELSHF